MRLILTLLFIFVSVSVFPQKQCDCSKVLDFVTEQIENNSASYAHQVIEYQRKNEYIKHKMKVTKIAKATRTEKECSGVVQLYLSFLRDSHQKLYITNSFYPFETFEDTVSVKKFIKENVKNHELEESSNTESISGNWYYKNGLFSIQIQNNNTKERQYIGVLREKVKTNNQFLGYKGDLRIEFYKSYNGELYAIFWDFGQSPSSYKVEYDKNTLKLGRNLIFYRDSSQIKTTRVILPLLIPLILKN